MCNQSIDKRGRHDSAVHFIICNRSCILSSALPLIPPFFSWHPPFPSLSSIFSPESIFRFPLPEQQETAPSSHTHHSNIFLPENQREDHTRATRGPHRLALFPPSSSSPDTISIMSMSSPQYVIAHSSRMILLMSAIFITWNRSSACISNVCMNVPDHFSGKFGEGVRIRSGTGFDAAMDTALR